MSDGNGMPGLVFEFSANGKASGTTVTARLGDDVLAVDKFDVLKSKSRAEFINDVCKGRAGLDRSAIEILLVRQAAEFASRQAAQKSDQDTHEPDGNELLERMPQAVRDEAREMLESPNLWGRILDDVERIGLAGEMELAATLYLLGVSRLLPRPLAAIVSAPSSTGKSYTIEKVSSLFPPECLIHATSLTPQALFYMQPGSLSHKWIVAGERSRLENDETAESTRALREMISGGRLTKLIPTKVNGEIVTQRIEQEGPIAFCESTTLSQIFSEDVNRCLLLSADERESQTANIINRLAQGYSGAVGAAVDAVVQRHHAAHRMIQQRAVIVPFAPAIAEKFPHDRIEARRAFPHLMSMVQASALLSQFQRQLDGDGCIIATIDDYHVAKQLARSPMARLLGGRISDATLRFYDRLAKWAPDQFNTSEAAKHDRKSKQIVRAWLSDLADVGAVQQLEPSKGSRPAVWKVLDVDVGDLASGGFSLPEIVS